MRTSFALASFFVLSLSFGCGDSSGDNGGGGSSTEGGGGISADGGSGAGVVVDGGGGSGAGGPVCEAPEGTPGAVNNVPVEMVTATARDDEGELITDEPLQLCGVNGCLYNTTNMLGQANFTNNLSSDTIDRPLVKPGDSLRYGKIGYAWETGAASPFPVVFPRMEDSGDAITPGSTVEAAGIEITVAADAVVTVDTLIYDTAEKQTFRAAVIPVDQVEAVTGDAIFSMAFSMGPVETLFCEGGGATATFPNTADLAPDTVVEIYAQELEVAEHFGPYGEWTKIADGVVSADGATVTTTGDGLPVLRTVAIRTPR